MKILGLDASTSTIGWGLLEDTQDGYSAKISLVTSGWWKPPKASEKIDGDVFGRLLKTKEFIFNLLKQHSPDVVVLEDIILFMKGHSTAKTVSSLAVLNRTVGLTVLEVTGQSPKMMNVMSVRHAIKEKAGRELPAKDQIPARMEKILNIPFPWTKKNNKKTGLDEIRQESYDEADGIAVAVAWWIKTNKIK